MVAGVVVVKGKAVAAAAGAAGAAAEAAGAAEAREGVKRIATREPRRSSTGSYPRECPFDHTVQCDC